MTATPKSDTDRVIIFDTTLRDGEQCPGATMTFEEKIEIAEMLDDMGVDVIEAGFPITSEGDFQAVSEIARRSKNAVIAGLSRANPKDIDRCAEAVKFAKRGRVHTELDGFEHAGLRDFPADVVHFATQQQPGVLIGP